VTFRIQARKLGFISLPLALLNLFSSYLNIKLICIFVMGRILSAHGIFKSAVLKKNTEAVISLVMKNMSCPYVLPFYTFG
jgi:hypothetical protein